MRLYYSDVLSPHKACAVARYLMSADGPPPGTTQWTWG